MSEVIEVIRDDLKKYLIYWKYDDQSENWTLFLRYQQDKVSRWMKSFRHPTAIETTSIYGIVKMTQDNTNTYTAFIPRDTRSGFKINLADDSKSYKNIGYFNSLELAMKRVLEVNNPLSSNLYI